MEFDKTVVDAMFKEAIPSVVESLKSKYFLGSKRNCYENY